MTIQMCAGNYQLGPALMGIELTADDCGLTACRLLPKPIKAAMAPSQRFLAEADEKLRAYFSGDPAPLKARLAPDGTEFQKRVWKLTASIPRGEVRSYAWLAEQAGNPRAVRAVAQALGANPLLLFVPCHRVIRSDGSLGGFSCGLQWKELLLEHEGVLETA